MNASTVLGSSSSFLSAFSVASFTSTVSTLALASSGFFGASSVIAEVLIANTNTMTK